MLTDNWVKIEKNLYQSETKRLNECWIDEHTLQENKKKINVKIKIQVSQKTQNGYLRPFSITVCEESSNQEVVDSSLVGDNVYMCLNGTYMWDGL